MANVAEHLLMCLRDICISPLNDRKVFLSLYHEPGLLVTRPMTGNKTQRRSGLYQARSAWRTVSKQTSGTHGLQFPAVTIATASVACKRTRLFSYSPGGQKSVVRLIRLRPRGGQGWVSTEAPGSVTPRLFRVQCSSKVRQPLTSTRVLQDDHCARTVSHRKILPASAKSFLP